MSWQSELVDDLTARVAGLATLEVFGSVADAAVELDGWSDLDLEVTVAAGTAEPVALLDAFDVWAASEERSNQHQVLRVVLRDGRRLDCRVVGGLLAVPAMAPDNTIRVLAALAATKLGRSDRLIGLHLTLELMRSCLVQAMQLRDRAVGTTVHRTGSELDALADEVLSLAGGPLGVVPRPNVVERTVALYGRWRHQLEPGYEPDWSGLTAVLDRGLAGQRDPVRTAPAS